MLLIDPAAGAIKGDLAMDRSNFDPEIALSPDGKRLYVLRISPIIEPGLLVVDTSSGNTIQSVSSLRNIQYTLPFHS